MFQTNALRTNLQHSFKETNASEFAIGVFLKEGGNPISYHSKALLVAKLNYNSYDII